MRCVSGGEGLEQDVHDPCGRSAVPILGHRGAALSPQLAADRFLDLLFFVPATIFVPHSTVTGLSVFSLTVTQGMPKHVVSSWMPPESVTTIAACFIKHRKSRYPKGSVSMIPAPVFPGASASPRDLAAFGPAGRSRPKSLMRCRVRGWTGNMMGQFLQTRKNAQKTIPLVHFRWAKQSQQRVRANWFAVLHGP